MKVLMVSTSYPANSKDWRGRFIADLATGLARKPEIEMSLWAPPGELPPGVAAVTTEADETWLRHLSQRGGIAHLLRTDRLRAAGAAFRLLTGLRHAYRRTDADLIHVNWLQNALPLRSVRTPAIVSVLGTDFGLLRVPGMTSALRSVFRRRRTILAPNAAWMAPMLQDAFDDIADIRPVPFGIAEHWFNLARCRRPDEPHHWLVITRLTRNKVGDLFEWGDQLFGKHRVLHLFGPMQENLTIPSWIQYHGPTHPLELRDTWFPIASGLVTLSRHDEGRPQVMLEAMASGLPVIASDLPAHRNMIAHRKTGWIATNKEDFASGLDYMEQEPHASLIGRSAREWAAQEVGTWDDCATRYMNLYAKLLESTQ